MVRLLFTFLSLCLLSCQSGDSRNWTGGVDKNSNGIRDDVDTWISSKSKDNIRLAKALETLARVNPASCEYSIKARCINELSSDGIILQVELLDLQLNTKELRENFENNVKNCPRIDDRNINYKCDL